MVAAVAVAVVGVAHPILPTATRTSTRTRVTAGGRIRLRSRVTVSRMRAPITAKLRVVNSFVELSIRTKFARVMVSSSHLSVVSFMSVIGRNARIDVTVRALGFTLGMRGMGMLVMTRTSRCHDQSRRVKARARVGSSSRVNACLQSIRLY